jgi:hypothetical protein
LTQAQASKDRVQREAGEKILFEDGKVKCFNTQQSKQLYL